MKKTTLAGLGSIISILFLSFNLNAQKTPEAVPTKKVDVPVNQSDELAFLKIRDAFLGKPIAGDNIEKLNRSSLLTPILFDSIILAAQQQSWIVLSAKFKTIINSKNEQLSIQESKLDEWNAEKKGGNTFILILIILGAGLLGGIARNYYPYLTYLQKKNIEATKAKVQQTFSDASKAKLPEAGHPALLANVQQKVVTAIQTGGTNTISSHSFIASVLFGIIASSLAFFALNAMESDILNFKENTDYFILWALCILGAVFARDWIESMYHKVKALSSDATPAGDN